VPIDEKTDTAPKEMVNETSYCVWSVIRQSDVNSWKCGGGREGVGRYSASYCIKLCQICLSSFITVSSRQVRWDVNPAWCLFDWLLIALHTYIFWTCVSHGTAALLQGVLKICELW